MSDVLAGLADPVEPDNEFRESLFESLAAGIDFEHARPRPARSSGSVFNARRFVLYVAVGLLLILLGAGLGAAMMNRQSEIDPIRRSQQVYRSMPAFDATVDEAGFLNRYRYDGGTLLRADPHLDAAARNVSTYWLFDGQTQYFIGPDGFEHAENALNAPPETYGGVRSQDRHAELDGRLPPLALYPLSWPYDGEGLRAPFRACEPEGQFGPEVVEGRLLDHVRCRPPGPEGDYWIDPRSGLITQFRWTDGSTTTAVSMTMGGAVDTQLFSVPRGPHGEHVLQRGPLAAGSYSTVRFAVPLSLTLASGWSDGFDQPGWGSVKSPLSVMVEWALPQALVDPRTGTQERFSGDTRSFVRWFRDRAPGFFGGTQQVVIGGFPGLEFAVLGEGSTNCRSSSRMVEACVFQDVPSGTVQRGLVVNVRGQVVVLALSAPSRASLLATRAALSVLSFD
jgi:hypothetical protein